MKCEKEEGKGKNERGKIGKINKVSSGGLAVSN